MKLVVIMSIDAYASILEKVYEEQQIPVYSEMDIKGFRLEGTDAVPTGWFGTTHVPVYSKLTFAFVSDESADRLLEAIDRYNREQELANPIRVFQMKVERGL